MSPASPKPRVRPVLVSALLLCLVSSPATAWHEAGHRFTAEIAFGLLSDGQQRHVTAMLRAHPRYREDFAALMPEEISKGSDSDQAEWTFAHAANWPDQVQNDSDTVRRKYHRSTWHYINLPVYLSERDETELAGKLDQNLSMEFSPPLRRNLNIVQALQGNLLVWRDAAATDADKAVALCWILHLAGDMHEPLHNVALFSTAYFPEGDRGGNLIGIRRAKDITNLHVVWDGLVNNLVTPPTDDNTAESLSDATADLHSIPNWAKQHRDIAAEFVYTAEVRRKLTSQQPGRQSPVITLSRDYMNTAAKIAHARIIIAGHRIAALISN